MPFVTIGVFHDQKRKFVQQEVQTEHVNAIEIDITLMGGPVDPSDPGGHWRPFVTRKVTMLGTHLYVNADDIRLLKT